VGVALVDQTNLAIIDVTLDIKPAPSKRLTGSAGVSRYREKVHA
jgi:hypothetical protein